MHSDAVTVIDRLEKEREMLVIRVARLEAEKVQLSDRIALLEEENQHMEIDWVLARKEVAAREAVHVRVREENQRLWIENMKLRKELAQYRGGETE